MHTIVSFLYASVIPKNICAGIPRKFFCPPPQIPKPFLLPWTVVFVVLYQIRTGVQVIVKKKAILFETCNYRNIVFHKIQSRNNKCFKVFTMEDVTHMCKSLNKSYAWFTLKGLYHRRVFFQVYLHIELESYEWGLSARSVDLK